jgi:polyisoprenoid-binding protein YceI
MQRSTWFSPSKKALAVAAWLISMPTAEAASTRWVGAGGEIEYLLVHKFHQVHGKSKEFTVTALIDAQGLKVMVRAPVKSFDSGNTNRDAHMQEVVDAAHFPYVTVRALAAGFTLPPSAQPVTVQLEGEIELHGVKTHQRIPLTVTLANSKEGRVSFKFEDSLTAHHIERPALFFVPVNDALVLSGDVPMRLEIAAEKT